MKTAHKILSGVATLVLLLSLGLNVFMFSALQNGNSSFTTKLQSLEERIGLPSNNSNRLVGDASVVATVKKVQPSVVSIIASKDIPVARQRSPFSDPFFEQFFGPGTLSPTPDDQDQNQDPNATRRVQVSGGSGFIYSKDGLIMTNKHVVSDENSEYTVILDDGTELAAAVLARDPLNDMAVVKVRPKEGEKLPELQPLSFGNSDELDVGEQVVAIGNPYEFHNTVTTGIISGLDRDIVAGGGRTSERLQGLLQIDAAINFGNSGGPLVNLAGEVIGMNTAIASGAEGIGFAIPSNILKRVADSVAKNGRIVSPFLGVQYVMLSEELAKKYQVDVSEGALLIGNTDSGLAIVKDSPAAKAGFREGDVIVSVDGEKVTSERDLLEIIGQKEVGQEITLVVRRDGEEREMQVKLEEFK